MADEFYDITNPDLYVDVAAGSTTMNAMLAVLGPVGNIATILSILSDIFGSSDVVPYTPTEILEQMNAQIMSGDYGDFNEPGMAELVGAMNDPVIVQGVAERAEQYEEQQKLIQAEETANSAVPVDGDYTSDDASAIVDLIAQGSLTAAQVASIYNVTEDEVNQAVANSQTGDNNDSSQSDNTGSTNGSTGDGNSGDGSSDGGETEGQEEENSLSQDTIDVLINILFGDGGFFTADTLGQLLTGGLTKALLDEVFGDEGERFLEFLDTAFPGTNPWERLAGNTGAGSVAGQDVNERMQIRQLSVQQAMNKATIDGNIKTAYIQNIPHMELVPSQIHLYNMDARLRSMQTLTEQQRGIIEEANAVVAEAQARANVTATQYGHLTGLQRVLRDTYEGTKDWGPDKLNQYIGEEAYNLLNDQEKSDIISIIDRGRMSIQGLQDYARGGIFTEEGRDALEGVIDIERIRTLIPNL